MVLLGRDPSTDGGCHWVDEQDVASVTRLLQGELEEVEEALQAVQEGSASAAAGRALLSECGDVLWNAMLLCHVAGRAVRESSSGEERSGSGSAIVIDDDEEDVVVANLAPPASKKARKARK